MTPAPRLRSLVAVACLVTAAAALPLPTAQAGPSTAAATLPERLVVAGEQMSVTVATRPFRLAFRDATGATVLAHVPHDGQGPLPGLTTDLPGGAEILPDSTRYSPFTYEVGGDATAQFPAAPWVGAILAAGRGGLQFSTTDVKQVERVGDTVRLVVGTDDPVGREVLVRLDPDSRGTVRVSMRVTPDAGVVAVANSFTSPRGEAFRGFGGRHTRVDQRGRTLSGWIQAQNVSAGQLQPGADLVPGTGGEDYLFPNGPTAAYYVHNSFVSSQRYGFALDRTELTRWRMASDRADAWQVDLAAPGLDYVVAPGPVRRAVTALTELNGRHRMPPRWAQGTTLYRGVKVLSADADTPESYEAKVRADLRRIDRHDLDVTSYAIEGWAILERPVLRSLVRELHRRGIKVQFYIRSFVSADPANTEPPELFTEAVEKGYVATNAAGAPYLFGSTFVAGAAALIDFTDPEAVRWWRGRVREMLDLGADGFMQDFGEQVLADMHFADGSTGATMHNAYPTLYHRATRRVVDEYERQHPGRRTFFFTRAGFSGAQGTKGSAAYEGANFPGDETTDWTRASGLPSIVPDMLNRAVGGSWGFTTDIGGYFDYTSPPVTEELFTRWSQATALMPYFRVHNSSSTGVKMPWSFGPTALARFQRAARLHDRALPYLRRLQEVAVRTGIPPTRPLWLQFPRQRRVAAVSDQWMLGDAVLVAPVLTEGARTRRVVLPDGCWRYAPTGRRHQGGQTVRVGAGLGTLPYFVRCGARPL